LNENGAFFGRNFQLSHGIRCDQDTLIPAFGGTYIGVQDPADDFDEIVRRPLGKLQGKKGHIVGSAVGRVTHGPGIDEKSDRVAFFGVFETEPETDHIVGPLQFLEYSRFKADYYFRALKRRRKNDAGPKITDTFQEHLIRNQTCYLDYFPGIGNIDGFVPFVVFDDFLTGQDSHCLNIIQDKTICKDYINSHIKKDLDK